MPPQPADVVVAGHICLDIIPEFDSAPDTLDILVEPGRLTEVGAAVIAPGGAVSNAGLALHRLGLSPRLVGKVGDDLFGEATLSLLRERDERLVEEMISVNGEPSSYTIVVSPPGVERLFFHCPGPNETFRPEEVSLDNLTGARFLHFGYPPILRQVYVDGGKQLAQLFEEARARGMVVSLDMTFPDPDSEAGQVDWGSWLTHVLPHVDLFGPNLEEILFMLDRSLYERMKNEDGEASFPARAETGLLDRLSQALIERGVPLVALKLGDQGLYLRTAEDPDLFRGLSERLALDVRRWTGRQLLLPPFKTEVVGTTGAGDAAVAGLLVGLHHGLSPEATVRGAVAVGTFNVEAPDATSGIPSWEKVQTCLRSGWEQRALDVSHPGWTWNEEHALWIGPEDTLLTVHSG